MEQTTLTQSYGRAPLLRRVRADTGKCIVCVAPCLGHENYFYVRGKWQNVREQSHAMVWLLCAWLQFRRPLLLGVLETTCAAYIKVTNQRSTAAVAHRLSDTLLNVLKNVTPLVFDIMDGDGNRTELARPSPRTENTVTQICAMAFSPSNVTCCSFPHPAEYVRTGIR